jgi:hypothetical protein
VNSSGRIAVKEFDRHIDTGIQALGLMGRVLATEHEQSYKQLGIKQDSTKAD